MEDKIKSIELFQAKQDCCGCGACMNVCPQKAIHMVSDSAGFVYPEIDAKLCVSCGMCQKVCAYQKVQLFCDCQNAYSAASNNKDMLFRSASGGAFAEIAGQILKDGGYVYGAAFVLEETGLVVRHIGINDREGLKLLQGSKYVQSEIGYVYREIEEKLGNGEVVLFSGTPCQVNGLKGYLRKDYDNLYTIDIICHGVPSAAFFGDYIRLLMNKWNGKIRKFCFRDKTRGWGLNASITYEDDRGRICTKYMPYRTSSYYDMFIKGETYRENCYTCPYAQQGRVGDITLGDFWGVQREHPELMRENGGNYEEDNGVSCILVNTEEGKKLLNLAEGGMSIHSTTFSKIAAENLQLRHPSRKLDSREEILLIYEKRGYKAVEAYFNKRSGVRKYYYYLAGVIPKRIKKRIKSIIK